VARIKGSGNTTKAGISPAQELQALRVTFRDRRLTFRYYPQAKFSDHRWQAIREVVEPVIMPDGTERLVERFELIAWASTSGGLVDQLA
jgi:hypothetical protein